MRSGELRKSLGMILGWTAAVALASACAHDEEQQRGEDTYAKPSEAKPAETERPAAMPSEPAPGATAPDTRAAPSPEPMKLSDDEVRLLTDLHATNKMEIEMGKLAQQQASSDAVKSYGEMLATDHEVADQSLTDLASERAVMMADMPTARDEAERKQMKKDMAAMDKLRTLKGDAFDREFVTAMIDGHTRAIDKVDKASGNVSDAKVDALLTQVKPVLVKHLDRAKEIKATLKPARK